MLSCRSVVRKGLREGGRIERIVRWRGSCAFSLLCCQSPHTACLCLSPEGCCHPPQVSSLSSATCLTSAESTTEGITSGDNIQVMNFTTDAETAELRYTIQVITTVTFSLIFLLGMLGNGTVIWITGCRLQRTINTVWFFNLALADFISTCLVLVTVLYLLLDLHWPFGPVLCKLVNCIFGLSIYASILLLSAISIDRCVLVLFPVWCQNYRNPRLVMTTCVVIWILSIALVPGSYTLSEMSTESNRSSCKNLDVFEDWEKREAAIFTVCIFLYQFLVPLCVILISYAILLITLRRKKLNRSSKPFLVVTGVVFSFFLCWLPYHALALARVFLGGLPLLVSLVAVPLSKCLAMFNSCINPILYVFIGREFKDVVKKSITQVFKTVFEEIPH